MILKMQSVRVYGSDNRYGTEPHQNPCGKPLMLKDFPSNAEAIEVLLGEVPIQTFEAHRRKTALANVLLNMTFGKSITISDDYTLDDAIADELRNHTAIPEPKSFEWYVTISIKREIQIEDSLLTGKEFPIVQIPESTNIQNFREYAKPHIDRLSAVLSTAIGREFFEQIVLDEVLFATSRGVVTRIPQQGDFKVLGRLSLMRPLDSLDCSELREMLSEDRMKAYARNTGLESAIHWYSVMLTETDTWKAFQYAFLCLEILTHKVSSRLYGNVRESFEFKQPDGESLSELPMAELLGSELRLSLVAKFCVVALGLRPSEANVDVRIFKEAKEARNKFSHGEIRNESELPLHPLRELCSKYLEAIFRSTLFA